MKEPLALAEDALAFDLAFEPCALAVKEPLTPEEQEEEEEEEEEEELALALVLDRLALEMAFSAICRARLEVTRRDLGMGNKPKRVMAEEPSWSTDQKGLWQKSLRGPTQLR